MKSLDPTIQRISKHYGFSWHYDEVLEKWIVRSARKDDTDFYWSSEYTFEDFLDSLEEYFKDMVYYGN